MCPKLMAYGWLWFLQHLLNHAFNKFSNPIILQDLYIILMWHFFQLLSLMEITRRLKCTSVARILISLGMKLTSTIIYYNLWSSFVCRLSTMWNYAHNLSNLNHLAMLMNTTCEIQKRCRHPLIVAISAQPGHLCTLNFTLWKWLLTYTAVWNLISHFTWKKGQEHRFSMYFFCVFGKISFLKIVKWRIKVKWLKNFWGGRKILIPNLSRVSLNKRGQFNGMWIKTVNSAKVFY